MTVSELCAKIALQPEIAARVAAFSASFDRSSVEPLTDALCDAPRSREAYEALLSALGEDADGTKILSCYLHAALQTHARYAALGIDEQIFLDTVKCFPRFIGECLERKGVLAFDRAHWSYRHLNMSIMRLGTLEFEWKTREGERVIAVHIPTDADFTPAALDESFVAARRITRTHVPTYADAPITCESWLMGEALHKVLKPTSKILQFQARFDILQKHPVNAGYLTFIFHRADCSDVATLPEDTSLQRNVKALLLSGGGIDGGFGVLREDPPV